MAQHGTAWQGPAQPGMVRHSPARPSLGWHGTAQHLLKRVLCSGARGGHRAWSEQGGPRLPAPCQGLLSPRALLPLSDPHPPPHLPARLPAHLLGCSPALCASPACLPASIPPCLSLQTPQCRRRATCRGSGRARGPSGNLRAVPHHRLPSQRSACSPPLPGALPGRMAMGFPHAAAYFGDLRSRETGAAQSKAGCR